MYPTNTPTRHELGSFQPNIPVTPPVADANNYKALPIFSYYKAPVINTEPYSTIDIILLHKIITQNKDWKLICESIRAYKNKDEQKKYKITKLDYFTASGIFTKRHTDSLIEHSGLLCLDFDNLTDVEINDLKIKLINDKEIDTALLFLSPTGTGLKWIIKIPADVETHDKYFDGVRNYINNTYGVEVDKSGRDIARACFISHDRDAYLGDLKKIRTLGPDFLAKWGKVIDRKPKVETPRVLENNEPENTSNAKRIEDVQKLAAKLVETKTDITTPYANWIDVGFALCELDEDGRDLFHKISSVNADYDYDTCDDKYSSLLGSYDGNIKLGTLFHMAKEHKILVTEPIEKAVQVNPVQENPVRLSNIPRTASQRLKDAENQPIIKRLLGDMWFTGEVHFLFGDTGTGKSIWATQICNAISKGENVCTVLPNENGPQKVLFYDFELSDRQFQKRYMSDDGKYYEFSSNFHIDNIDRRTLKVDDIKKGENVLITKIKSDIETLRPAVLVIDNITYLATESTQETNVALQLMNVLMDLKNQYKLSILVLAHSPKLKVGTPLTLNELGGSKHLSNFADSVSGIGKSTKSPDLRYFIQAKGSRSSEVAFDSGNVILAKIQKEDTFLGFKYVECVFESEHLKTSSDEAREKKKLEEEHRVMELHEEGKSLREIEELTGISKSKVGRIINS